MKYNYWEELLVLLRLQDKTVLLGNDLQPLSMALPCH